MADRPPKITIGMACYDDFDGVWFSVMALRMYHAALMPDVELLVVDNNPDSPQGQAVRGFINDWVGNARYVPFDDPKGPATAKNEVFRQARGNAILCMDSHVLLEPDSVGRLIEYYDSHPDCQDLLQGPLIYDDLRTYSSHLENEWRGEMLGTWATDRRANVRRETSIRIDPQTAERQVQVRVTEYAPFEIPAQGMGAFSCRKESWLGFNPHFRGFGGEEYYIHEKFRQAGRRTVCLPFLRWVHRFNRPNGVPYELTVENKFRNYVIGHLELGLPIDPVINHFTSRIPNDSLVAIVSECKSLSGKTYSCIAD